eukprot:CAMPEP_0202054638 /NCGR_PEP_ID=MMETSP0963-20130614/9032_1 /ASSEMBLY_ACC=CAM_ASM_000494 /TAXON_ID=4773 /ORGANISM="Schizochytrium aggregatum, Strain ATCC28209" /LENGTH=110 /DNA_ID=CAMNT_0048620107 /DNA_START=365 /DNA_END=695 /DNA_ORIENTATION=-
MQAAGDIAAAPHSRVKAAMLMTAPPPRQSAARALLGEDFSLGVALEELLGAVEERPQLLSDCVDRYGAGANTVGEPPLFDDVANANPVVRDGPEAKGFKSGVAAVGSRQN